MKTARCRQTTVEKGAEATAAIEPEISERNSRRSNDHIVVRVRVVDSRVAGAETLLYQKGEKNENAVPLPEDALASTG